jgi:opacity protein-like surface antigen
MLELSKGRLRTTTKKGKEMNKVSLLSVAVAAFVSAGASAEVRPYVGVDDLFNPFNTARIGFDLGNNVRLEGDIGYRQDKQGNDKETTTKVGLTGFYDIKTNSNVTPFVGAGLYRTSEKIEGATGTTTDTNTFGWTVKAGAAFEVVKNFNLDVTLGYDSEKDKGIDDRKNGLGLGLGARYAF